MYIKDLTIDEKAAFMAYLRSLASEKTETDEPVPVVVESNCHTDAGSMNH